MTTGRARPSGRAAQPAARALAGAAAARARGISIGLLLLVAFSCSSSTTRSATRRCSSARSSGSDSCRRWPQRIVATADRRRRRRAPRPRRRRPWSLVLVLACGVRAHLVPQPTALGRCRSSRSSPPIFYPFFDAHLFTIPVFGALPDVADGRLHDRLHDDGRRPEHRRRLRGLLDLGYVAFYAIGAYTAAWFASAQFAGQKCPTKGVSVDDCAAALVPKRDFNFGAIGVLPGPAASTSRSGDPA